MLMVLTALAATCLSFPLSAGGTADSPVRLGSLALRGGSGRNEPEARGECGADGMLVKAEQLKHKQNKKTKASAIFKKHDKGVWHDQVHKNLEKQKAGEKPDTLMTITKRIHCTGEEARRVT